MAETLVNEESTDGWGSLNTPQRQEKGWGSLLGHGRVSK